MCAVHNAFLKAYPQTISLCSQLRSLPCCCLSQPPSAPAPAAAAMHAQGISSNRSSPVHVQQPQLLLNRQPPARQPPAQLQMRRPQQPQLQVVEAAAASMPPVVQPASLLNPGPVAPKPSDEWRQGEKTGFPSPPRTRGNPLRRSLGKSTKSSHQLCSSIACGPSASGDS